MTFPNAMIKTAQLPTGVTALAGAAPQTGAGSTLNMNQVEAGTLAARVYAQATTSSLTIAGKWQVLDDDGATWIDCAPANNPANVVLTTGTGSAVAATKSLEAPAGVYGRRKARFVVLTAGATAAAGDEYSIEYDYRSPTGF